MILELRGDDIVMLDVPHAFTLPERFPVTWNTGHKAFSVPRRHSSVPALVKLLLEQGLVTEVPEGWQRRGRMGVAARSARVARPMPAALAAR